MEENSNKKESPISIFFNFYRAESDRLFAFYKDAVMMGQPERAKELSQKMYELAYDKYEKMLGVHNILTDALSSESNFDKKEVIKRTMGGIAKIINNSREELGLLGRLPMELK